ncbi:MAG: hypothetical protein RM347_011870 [Nostoc sp. ChiQUE02]|uniref:hypothetical protein n=1 Tax=Nostoc sp. ChiQUE02 TaxID=3075377 RepID=UPI002AD3B9ED|nr:hypothetical protein [Nostoc sp. ChiQUE02]MDZ8229332.1 hypothetical protein [Nostoc sp. ChiQUE02]
MSANKKYNHQMEINDLIDDAIVNAVTRRELVETLSDEEAARVAGGLTAEATKVPVSIKPEIIAGFKPIQPIKPICPPLIVGLIALPDDRKLTS